jgi:hypothetical protein
MVRAEAYHTAVHLEYPIINLGVTFRRGRPPRLICLHRHEEAWLNLADR